MHLRYKNGGEVPEVAREDSLRKWSTVEERDGAAVVLHMRRSVAHIVTSVATKTGRVRTRAEGNAIVGALAHKESSPLHGASALSDVGPSESLTVSAWDSVHRVLWSRPFAVSAIPR